MITAASQVSQPSTIDMLTLIVLVATLLFIGWQSYIFSQQTKQLKTQTKALTEQTHLFADQTRLLAEETRLATQLAVADTYRDAVTHLQQVQDVFVEHPHLRAFFHDDKPVPDGAEMKAQVMTVAEAIVDSIEASILQSETVDELRRDLEDWQEVARFFVKNSPAIRALVPEHRSWWPAWNEELDRFPTPDR